ncbi:MAG: hypothetical protein D6729_16765, partial [Deltaproteobacteria bacterium]
GASPGVSSAAFQRALPGVDDTDLDDAERAALLKVAEDALCDCGAPTTLKGCLVGQPECLLGQRMIGLARLLVKAGGAPLEVTSFVEKYYESFEPGARKTIEVDPAACLGPKDAKVTLVEFADFECPYCGFAWPLVKQVLHDARSLPGAKDQLRWCYLHFPLKQHPNAHQAAQLAEFAKQHGKFFALAEKLYTHQQALDREHLLQYAKEVGLDPKAAERALASGTFAAAVDAQKAQGTKLGVEGTPSLFLNGRPFILPLNHDLLLWALEDELLYVGNGGKW